MFDLTTGNKFKLKDYNVLYRTMDDTAQTAFNKYDGQRHLMSLRAAAPDGIITIVKETADKILIEEQSADYPGSLFIQEWMIKEHIAE